MNTIKAIFYIFAVSIFISSCAVNKSREAGGDGLPLYDTAIEANDDLVASNLIYIVSQLEEVPPVQTTLQLNEPITDLGKTIEARLRDAGYGIQKVGVDEGPNYVRYKYEQSTTEKGDVTRYTMSIGDLSVERDYVVQEGKILPDSAILVTGATDTEVDINDNIFSGTGTEYVEDVFFDSNEAPIVVDVVNQSTDKYAGIASGLIAKKNMYDLEISNYSGLFDKYQDVNSEVLVFANDSMVLGAENKSVVREYVRNMNPDTDIISIIGCSHGNSQIKNGNSVLAIGRANRVKEAFIFAGVDHDKVYDEGCWAPRHFDEVMPRRGVVLKLKRLRG